MIFLRGIGKKLNNAQIPIYFMTVKCDFSDRYTEDQLRDMVNQLELDKQGYQVDKNCLIKQTRSYVTVTTGFDYQIVTDEIKRFGCPKLPFNNDGLVVTYDRPIR